MPLLRFAWILALTLLGPFTTARGDPSGDPEDRVVPMSELAFSSTNADGEFSTVASGNSFVVQSASDSTITVRNAQNELFYLRLVLE
jgi:hypothetical protein